MNFRYKKRYLVIQPLFERGAAIDKYKPTRNRITKYPSINYLVNSFQHCGTKYTPISNKSKFLLHF